MKSFKEYNFGIKKPIENFEETTLYSFLRENTNTSDHKIFESYIPNKELDEDYLYTKYINLLDESYITEEIVDTYQKSRREAIDSGKSGKDYYRDISGKPYDGEETRLNRQANLTELLPCIWYYQRKGKPFLIPHNGTKYLFTINKNNKTDNTPEINQDSVDSTKIKYIILKTLDYVKEHQAELSDIIKYGQKRYTLKVNAIDGKNENEPNNLYRSLRQDLLLTLETTQSNKNIDRKLVKGSDSAQVISHNVTFEDEKGKTTEKRFIDRDENNLFQINDLIHGLNQKEIEDLIKVTTTARNKCIQALNIYQHIATKTFDSQTIKNMEAVNKDEIKLYWSCSNSSKGDFDVDYTNTTSDIIAKSNKGKTIGISLKAANKLGNFRAKSFNIQSLLVHMLNFNKDRFNEISDKLIEALWDIQGYKNLITENGVEKITKEKFIQYKRRALLDDKSVKYEYIHNWNILFNNAIFKSVMKKVDSNFKELTKTAGVDIELEVMRNLSNEITETCGYIYENSYLDIYIEFMEKMVSILNNYLKNEWNGSMKNEKRKMIDNLFGEEEGTDVRIIVGTNDFETTIDATKYNESLIKKILTNENSYPELKLNSKTISIGFNGLSRDYDIYIELDNINDNYSKLFEKEETKNYYFAWKDYFENYIEKKKYYSNDNYTYRTLKKSLDNKNYKYTKNYNLDNSSNLLIKEKNKLSRSIIDSIGKMSKVANFPFNSQSLVLFDFNNFIRRVDYENRANQQGR